MTAEDKNLILHMFANVAEKLTVIKSVAKEGGVRELVDEAQIVLDKIWDKINES